MHENMLMTTFETEHGENQAAYIRYWGYIKKDSPEELKEYLKPDNKKKKLYHSSHQRQSEDFCKLERFGKESKSWYNKRL